ncbi:MAG: polysaccharide deacetylase family protein [Treponema sp.]|nr:polysaccharide deacetylase family protein [Treponema sp.]
MKKLVSFIFAFTTVISLLSAKISFGSIDINQKDEVLFTVKQEMTGTNTYRSLFLTKIKNGSPEKQPELLTCYPEQMELLQGGKILQLRNRYGTGRYNSETATFNWQETVEDLPEDSLPVSPYSVSPDGKYLCKIEKINTSSGILSVQNVATGKTAVLCDEVMQSYEKLPVKWSISGSILLYEKEGFVYFCNPDAVLRGVEMDEMYRKIGRGTINSVNWASDKYLVYIDDYLVYQINAKELYTLGLYSGIIGQGKAIGRLPSQFNPKADRFSVNSSVNSLVIIQNNRLFSYLRIEKQSCDYLDVIFSKPYTDSSASLVDSYVFWDRYDNPILWLEKLPYDGKKERGSVYKLSSKATQVLEIEDSGKPFISPDGDKVAFFAGAAIYVYDINTWQRSAELYGEKISSALWINRSVIYVGGDKTVRRWNLLTNTYETILLSSATAGYWNHTDGSIIADTSSGIYYKYNRNSHIWSKVAAPEISPVVQNGRYRVFNGTTPNSQYENALYVRTLSKTAVTKPVYTKSAVKTQPYKKVALAFDAYDNADGLSRILSILQKYNVPATFFVNGEFVRRYPNETKQIVKNGYDCGSMFFSCTDLVNNPFVVDEQFIRRGLARDEDEFFNCTGEELSLYWHAPYHSVEPKLITYGDAAGYTYVNSYHNNNDCDKLDKDTKPEQLIQEYIDSLNATNGGIVPVTIGFSQGNRTDPLYNYLDLLICALLNSGVEFVTVNQL